MSSTRRSPQVYRNSVTRISCRTHRVASTQDSILYVGAEEGVMAEAVPVVQIVNQQTFNGSFQNPHDPNVTMTQSSLVNRQFRISQNYPIFTILAVIDQNTLLLDQPWGGPPLVNQQYSIIKMYYTFQPNTKEILWVLDQSRWTSAVDPTDRCARHTGATRSA